MDEFLLEFTKRNKSSEYPLIIELISAIEAGKVQLQSHSENNSSTELAKTYSIRSSIALEKGHLTKAKVMESLASKCRANSGNFCTIWLFDGVEKSYAVFELMPYRIVAECIDFEGSISGDNLSQA
jgi:hypothetical protein